MSANRRTYWGWHRLDPEWAGRLVADAGVGPGELVLDIGAGTGVLTAALVATGARVVALELHPARVAVLRARFATAPVRVVRADVTDVRTPRRPFRVVANPPFAVTTALLRRLVAPGTRLLRADLVVARHHAHRWSGCQAPGAGRWRADFDAAVVGSVPRWAFRPPSPRAAAHLVVERRQPR